MIPTASPAAAAANNSQTSRNIIMRSPSEIVEVNVLWNDAELT